MQFERRGYLPGREGSMTDVIELHYGKFSVRVFAA